MPALLNNWSLAQLYSDVLPYELIICTVETESYLGARHKSPWDFKHFDVDTISLSIEGYQDMIFNPSFDNPKDWTSEYLALYATREEVHTGHHSTRPLPWRIQHI